MSARRAVVSALAVLAAGSVALAQTPTPTPETMMSGHAMSDAPHLTLRGFSNIDFAVHEESKPTTFALGQVDLFFTSALSDNISVLAEMAVEFEEHEQGLDVERIQFKWTPSSAFSLAAGRMHTPLGYWNQTFHHGTWFQTTELRPRMYFFEDDEGILPVHGVGVAAAGVGHSRVVDLKYSVSVVNGRGPDSEEVVHVQDATSAKAVNVWLALAPTGLPGFELGGSAYFDSVPPDNTVRTEEMREHIVTGYLAYEHSGLELLAEGSRIQHRLGGTEFRSSAAYVQASWQHDRYRPYYRFDLVDVASDDPYLPHIDDRIHTLGLRVEASAWVALKGEYRLLRRAGETTHAGRAQVAFTF
jgi:hypothetical protein